MKNKVVSLALLPGYGRLQRSIEIDQKRQNRGRARDRRTEVKDRTRKRHRIFSFVACAQRTDFAATAFLALHMMGKKAAIVNRCPDCPVKQHVIRSEKCPAPNRNWVHVTEEAERKHLCNQRAFIPSPRMDGIWCVARTLFGLVEMP